MCKISHKNMIALYTLTRKEVVRILRIWPQTLVPPMITMSLYFMIFGRLIGARIGPMDGFSYVQYIMPGLIMMSMITNAYANVASTFFSAKFQRYIEEMLVAPISYNVIIWGHVFGGVLRSVLVGSLVSVISLLFTHVHLAHPGMTLAMGILTAILFSLAGLLNGIFARKFDDISIIPTFILTPLTYLGGIFYSVDLLPELWKKLTLVNPVFYIVNGFRYGVLGDSDVSIYTALGLIMMFIVILYTLAYWLLKKGVGIKQ